MQAIREPRTILWTERDIGYGSESGEAVGYWGQRNPEGHRTFETVDGSSYVYLFDDEIDSDEPYCP